MTDADGNFIVESILSGAAPWLELSSETTLTYACFGGNSPFANWVGDNPAEWDSWPTSESLFLTADLGEKIRTWVRALDRCQMAGHRGRPAVDDSEFVAVALEGLDLCERIREQIPYYYVEPDFFKTLPGTVKDRVEDQFADWRGYRKLDGNKDMIDRHAMPFQPYGSSQMPPELSALSAAIKAFAGRYGGNVVDPDSEIWDKLDAWQLQYQQNFLGLPEQRGSVPRWRAGFDRLGRMAEGLALQQESSDALSRVRLSCGAAHLAVSKDEWDLLLRAYLANQPDCVNAH